MKIAIEYIRWLQDERVKINKAKLEEIEFYEKGMVVDASTKTIEEFNFTGLNNVDFILSGFYKRGRVKK